MNKPCLALIVLVAVVTCYSATTRLSRGEGPTPSSNPTVVEKLREIVDLRERILRRQQVLVEAGKAADDGTPLIALAEARIAVARELGDRAEVIAQLEKIVEERKRILDLATNRAADGVSPLEVDEQRIELLKAEVDLEREKAARAE